MEVSCSECPFSRIVEPDEERLPADVLTAHGQETGHKLAVNRIDE